MAHPRCKASPKLLRTCWRKMNYGLARPVVDVEKLGMLIGELRGEHVADDVECDGQLRARAGDEARGLPRVAGVELGLHWSGRARLRVELRVERPGRSAPFIDAQRALINGWLRKMAQFNIIAYLVDSQFNKRCIIDVPNFMQNTWGSLGLGGVVY